ncbi:putative ribonuclease H protein, partial [Trifolium medium]|nr:putative ribonuclease H protein [Trifolium medium]
AEDSLPHMEKMYTLVRVGCTRPTQGWIKFNIGRALIPQNQSATCALQAAKENGFNRVMFESDSVIDVDLIVKGCPPNHSCSSIVSRINRLKMQECEVSFHHIYRQANQIAIRLVRHTLTIPTSIHYLNNPLPGCIILLWQDIVGVLFNHRIPL